ncbi:hypothetical protein [Roseofilum casamattae]|uniref:Peptidase n=1 Tax=Roseofilum casamattae BLCC-M143 TaxID=3022442 RepID=A0ABT7BRJ4_9CYAN|nr:hypothetical protein [Roseofilum casamattae]MDJ1181818.1 peptidase [Roseofilum casamattae BLCC-M143]
MTDLPLDQVWYLISRASTLNPQAFTQVNLLPAGGWVALLVVFGAAIARAIAQCAVMWLYRVQPAPFWFSLNTSAIAFAFVYGFWLLSIGLSASLFFGLTLTPGTVAAILGLSYAPQLLGFLIALPYLPVSVLLSLWTLLAVIVGLGAIAPLNLWEAFACALPGWMVWQLCDRSLGRLVNVLARYFLPGLKQTAPTETEPTEPAGDRTTQTLWWTDVRTKPSRPPLNTYAKLAIAISIGFVLAFLFSPSSYWQLANWYGSWGESLHQNANLILISLIALCFSLLPIPTENVGWWAGWYGEGDLRHPKPPANSATETHLVGRYAIYIDGISQGTDEYLPNVELFLNRLAASLPDSVRVVKRSSKPPIARYWQPDGPWRRIWDSLRWRQPERPMDGILTWRNAIAAAVAADPRYGPLQNRILAQRLLDRLVQAGYDLDRKTPIALIGYSGGAQMGMAAVPYLSRATGAPITTISLCGLVSGNRVPLEAEELYYLTGDRDRIERLAALLFPGRWAIAIQSNWNRAKRRGKVRFLPLESVTHDGPGNPFDSYFYWPDGQSNLDRTVTSISGILLQDWTLTGVNPNKAQISNYDRYRSVLFNQPESYPFYYPPSQTVDPQLYYPVGNWVGRLILPKPQQRQQIQGVLFEVHHADPAYRHLVGQVVVLRWSKDVGDRDLVQMATRDVHFVGQVRNSKQQGNIHPDRLNHWQAVTPLESLAGAHPVNDMLVKLPDPVAVSASEPGRVILEIRREPVQISGRFYGLVRFIAPMGDDRYQVRHYNRDSSLFDGLEETVYLPSVVPNRDGVLPSTSEEIEQSPLNSRGWHIFGAKNDRGEFVVQALSPYALFTVTPDRMLEGKRQTKRYIDRECWTDLAAKKGTISKVLLVEDPHQSSATNRGLYRGDRLLVLHLYGGIGGKTPEFAPMGISFGHFSYGVARAIDDPFTGELKFEIEYRQVYAHNTDGIVSGSLAWERYCGDRQWGWVGSRPVSDILVKFSPLTDNYDFDGLRFCPLDNLILELDIMAARYRVGDGTGTTFVTPINSCVQDSAQALYRAVERTVEEFRSYPEIQTWLQANPHHPQTKQFDQLVQFGSQLRYQLAPLQIIREDWRSDSFAEPKLGQFAIEQPLQTLYRSLASWRSLLPRLAHDAVTKAFLRQGAICWVLRTNQIGGFNPDIDAIAPTDFGLG